MMCKMDPATAGKRTKVNGNRATTDGCRSDSSEENTLGLGIVGTVQV